MRPILRALLISATFLVPATAVSLSPDLAWAGPNSEEIWFGTGADSLETNDDGAVTSEGEKTKTKEVDAMPGEEDWEIRIHSRLGKYAAEGPLYVEFYGKLPDGEEYIVYRHEDPDYAGERFYNATLTLESNIGFNKNREYRVQILQNNGKRDLILAKGTVTLIDTGREAPGGGDDGAEAEDEGADEEAEDEGEDEEEADDDEGDDGDGAPPPIEETPKTKKGCSVVEVDDAGFSGTAILLLLA
ncbi:MAG: hypothetical protein KC431_06390, partial [Myxococcales bacterium]|nr:hypothetical protein [Myxococcales bacterium]